MRFRLQLLCSCLSRYAVASFAVCRFFLAHFHFLFVEATALSAVDCMFFVLPLFCSYAVLSSGTERGYRGYLP